MLLVPLPKERGDLVMQVHRDMGHFGPHRILDRLKRNYWWKGMDERVDNVVRACMPCARTKAGFRVPGKEQQPLYLQGIMFRWILPDPCLPQKEETSMCWCVSST